MNSENPDQFNIDPRFQPLIEASRVISRQIGRGGVIDTPEEAMKKLFLGDPSKKAGDQAEADEIIEELSRDQIDPIGLASEIADYMYYRAKISNVARDEEYDFLNACGFTFEGAISAAWVKYGGREAANIMQVSKKERKTMEAGLLDMWLPNARQLGLFVPENIRPMEAIDNLSRLKEAILGANQSPP